MKVPFNIAQTVEECGKVVGEVVGRHHLSCIEMEQALLLLSAALKDAAMMSQLDRQIDQLIATVIKAEGKAGSA